jgi:hypothetical protein
MKFFLAVGTWMETANPLIWSGNPGHEKLHQGDCTRGRGGHSPVTTYRPLGGLRPADASVRCGFFLGRDDDLNVERRSFGTRFSPSCFRALWVQTGPALSTGIS